MRKTGPEYYSAIKNSDITLENYSTLVDICMERLGNAPEFLEWREAVRQQADFKMLILGNANPQNMYVFAKLESDLRGPKAAGKEVTVLDLHTNGLVKIPYSNGSASTGQPKVFDDIDKRAKMTNQFILIQGDILSSPIKEGSMDLLAADYTQNFTSNTQELRVFFRRVAEMLKQRGFLFMSACVGPNDEYRHAPVQSLGLSAEGLEFRQAPRRIHPFSIIPKQELDLNFRSNGLAVIGQHNDPIHRDNTYILAQKQ